MVNATYIQRKIYYGYNKAAIRLGYNYYIYRAPNGINPISPANLVGEVYVSPNVNWAYDRFNKYGNTIWQLVHDGRKTNVFDYLVIVPGQGSGNIPAPTEQTFFIGAQQLLLPILGVECNRRVTITRPFQNIGTGENVYGGYAPTDTVLLMQSAPCSVLLSTHSGQSNPLSLPLDTRLPRYQLLMPKLPGVELRIGDLVDDDRGVRVAITGVELTDLGYRLNVKSEQI